MNYLPYYKWMIEFKQWVCYTIFCYFSRGFSAVENYFSKFDRFLL